MGRSDIKILCSYFNLDFSSYTHEAETGQILVVKCKLKIIYMSKFSKIF